MTNIPLVSYYVMQKLESGGATGFSNNDGILGVSTGQPPREFARSGYCMKRRAGLRPTALMGSTRRCGEEA